MTKPYSRFLPSPYRDEAEVVNQSLVILAGALDWQAVEQTAKPWAQAVRDTPAPFWAMESLLKEYSISSAEGLALMRLAEALLRVPDAPTAIALTADQLGRADFASDSESAIARLSAQAIGLSKRFLPKDGNSGLMGRLGSQAVVAASLRAVQLLGKQFVLGHDIHAAQAEAGNAKRKQPRLRYSYDMLGEGARTDADALRYLASYSQAIAAIATQTDAKTAPTQSDGISIKLSALHPRYEFAQKDRVLAELLPRVWQLCLQAAKANINLTIDAEEVDRLELSLLLVEELLPRIATETPEWSGFGLALQAYQTRAVALITHLAERARAHGVKLMCRLVKGAYWDFEIKRAQELGLAHYPVFTHKHHTDINYLACAATLLAHNEVIYPQFATHNAATIAAIMQMAANKPYELQRLHGMGEGVYREVLVRTNASCRVYAPVGEQKDLLAYLVRRLLENGANSSFVHQLADTQVQISELLRSPLHLASHVSIALPAHILGQRQNSAGFDVSETTTQTLLLTALSRTAVDATSESNPAEVATAFNQAQLAWREWRSRPVASRAAILRKAADTFEQDMATWCALLVKEAFKTWGDAVAEVRETIDFLRYYADEAERIMQPTTLPGVTGESNVLRLHPRGVWVCISPWNFPLAIFMGQVAAALATGNAVLAKPAEQTPAIAVAAAKLLHAAGVPADAFQVLHGPGETVGAALVTLPRIAGVVFTGSTQVAKIIQRTLAAKDGAIVPLIAETGGINAMIVDSSALPEQVVDAVMQSSFRSAGQRCSALRLLCLHEDIADQVIEMIQGAAAELCTGDHADFATDVGAVIDREAFENIERSVATLRTQAKDLRIASRIQISAQNQANLIAPLAFEVSHIDAVGQEIFGPVLQITRWSGEPLAVMEAINALGYGLTLGIQTRIDSRAEAIALTAQVGNVYVNRNTIGAVVGVQPFGGEGLSGTGPKAGGPHYLIKFCTEQTLTINTTAAGGNASLLTQVIEI